MDLEYSIRGLIAMVVREETQFLRHYLGLVVDDKDELGRGRVLVTIPELGFDTATQGLWCWPRQADSLSVPKTDTYVEVYFMGGHPDRPVYLSYASEMLGSEFTLHTKMPGSRVIFESPETKEGIHYDDKTKKLVIKKGTEPFVLGTKLQTQLDIDRDLMEQLYNDINNIAASGTPVTLASLKAIFTAFLALGVAGMADYSNTLSEEIFGK